MPNKGKTQDGHPTPVIRALSIIETRELSMEHHTQPDIKYDSKEKHFKAICVCGHVSTSTNFYYALERSQSHVRVQWDARKAHLFTTHYEEAYKSYHVSCTCGWYEHDLEHGECLTEHKMHLEKVAKARN